MDTAPTPSFQLSLLGGFGLRGPAGPIDLPSKKLSGLLAFLACTAPRAHSRDKLMTLLWGSHFEPQARQNLRQAFMKLRRLLGEGTLIANAETVSLRPGALVCDVAQFEALLCQGTRDALKAAVALYRGGLLPDVAIPEEAWTEWLGVLRQRLESLALNAMVKLAELDLEVGSHEEALRVASQAAEISSLREDAHRLIMQALAAGGRRADALKHYEDLATLLKRELAVEPDPKTRALEAELRTPSVVEPRPAVAVELRRTQQAGQAADFRPAMLVRSDPKTRPNPDWHPPCDLPRHRHALRRAKSLEPIVEQEKQPLPDRPSIAVLPFANMSGDPEQEYFADGMVDDILMALSRVRWLFVIARQSSFIYKVRAADVQQIGRELGVRYVVEGSVRKSGTRVRIVAQLIETETGAHIWADRYEGDLRDIFALQDAITERIVSAVEVNVQDAEIRRARVKPTDSLTAYDLYLRALPAWFGQTQAEYRRTQVVLGKAIDVDPEYAEALGTLTDSVASGTLQGWQGSWTRGGQEACQLAGRALAAGPDNSTCLASAAFTYGVLSYRFDEAFELADRALMVHPNSLFVRNRAAAVYGVCGEADKAIAQCQAACRMNPLDSKKAATASFSILSFALYMARRFEESIRAGRRALAFTPNTNTARKYVAISLAQLGRTDEARVEIAELIKTQPDASLAVFRQHGFRHKWMQELHMEGLRKAGLREA
jgi:TolB-like protein/DNA-binding SARP family transcriptional activator